MPELPDIAAYIDALQARILGRPLERIRLASPFLLRTAEPPVTEVAGHAVRELRRIGKRIAIGFDNDVWLVLHLMIAGRLHWRSGGVKLGGRNNLAAFDFPNGSLLLTEAGTKRTIRRTVPKVRQQGAAYTLCRQGNELLRTVPDGWPRARGSGVVPAVGRGLAAHPG
jgi:formamidopyrimidine-DNA glycosylase